MESSSVRMSAPPPKSSHFVSVVLRTFDFVGIAPEKVNAHFVRASFFHGRDKSKVIKEKHGKSSEIVLDRRLCL